jgi:hypothetical protein
MRTLWRHSGSILAATGVVHMVVFAAVCADAAGAILRAGFVNTLDSDPSRQLFWFGGIIAGGIMVVFGLTLRDATQRTGRPAPRFLGWTLLVLGLATCLIDPLSGGWLLFPQGVIILAAPTSPVQASPPTLSPPLGTS